MVRPLTRWLVLALLTALIYLPGIHGPFLFDDTPNLVKPLSAWLDGLIDWREIVFGNGSGLLGRPLAMLTFLANAAISGLDTTSYKVANLAIHIFCGGLIYALLSRLLRRDPQLAAHASLPALLVSAIWLLHPMHVSTVLYVVQRMAQLSTLFMLLALLAYVLGRVDMERGRVRAALLYLFLGVPAATVAAMLSKENGALVPLLCAVIELGYFRASESTPRPRLVRGFFALFLILPAIVASVWIALNPMRLFAAYDGRLFTLTERLLSQPRALLEYIGALLVPRGPMLGVYTDDFVISRGLMDPPSTLYAIVGLIALVAVAIGSRRVNPAFFTGVGFFLAGHTMESTIFPLEMYFEHRNYLPSVGIFLALAGLAGWVWSHLPHADQQPRIRRLLAFGMAGLIAALGLATLARASVWGSWPAIAEQGARQHPQSLRAQLDYAQTLMAQGKHEEVRGVIEQMAASPNPAARHFAALDTLLLDCIQHGQVAPDAIAQVRAIAGERLQLAEMFAFKVVSDYLRTHECKGLSQTTMADLVVGILNAAPQPPTLRQIWGSRFDAAELYLRSGQLQEAQQQAELAWATGATDPPVGVFLATVYHLAGDPVNARRVIAEVRAMMAPWDRRGHKLLAALEAGLDANGRTSPGAVERDTSPPSDR